MSFKCTECGLMMLRKDVPKKCPICNNVKFLEALPMKKSLKNFLGNIYGRASEKRN